MKRLIKWSLCFLSVVCFIRTCVYHKITHITDEELEWVTNRHEDEVQYFKSQYGELDTLVILEVWIRNNLDPINWGYFNTSNKEYTASAQVRYGFKNRRNGGIMEIEKEFCGKPIYFSSVLLASNWLNKVPLKTSNLKINGIILSDIILFENIATDKGTTNPLVNYAWSKKYGLVQYKFQDGTSFTRIDIGN
ncbi:MAG: hypothetical protein SPF56_08975 [Bacteroidaceae bacterium]|nr:hypothetical protein [Bacteroidaceae bacterium]